MKLLALDTSSNACSVALRCGDRIVERHTLAARQHTKLLLPMIKEVLVEANVELSDLDRIVLGNGPGSFIGMRIAASVAQGLAFGAEVKIVPVSSLAAVAAEVFASSESEAVAVAQDARMHQVYLGLYVKGADGLPELHGPEALHPLGAIAWPHDHAWTAAGAGWQHHPQLLTANRAALLNLADVGVPRARFLLAMGAAGGEIEAHALQPAYIRSRVAAKATRSS